MTNPKSILLKLNRNLNTLQEREAKYGGNVPLELLNQIDDHKKAIGLTQQVISGELTKTEWCEALGPLLLAVNNGQVVNIETETYIAGDVKGDFVHGDKIITNIFETSPPPLPPADVQERRELKILLEKVKQFWINGVFKKSLYNAVLLDLGKETRFDVIAHPWEQVLELPDQTRQILSPDKKTSEIFDEVNRALLILGEPGSGKTITLLALAHDLITRAEDDEMFSQPIPVVFNLSSWTNKKQSLIDWMIAELTTKYQIPKRIGRSWLESNRLLLLLDGLDEVRPENRAVCVEVINQFCEEFGFAGLVVCSRLKEYTVLPVRLKLNGAICLQPLTHEQVEEFLAMAGQKLSTLRTILQSDTILQDLVQSPLMLSIMSLAYQDIPIEKIVDDKLRTIEARHKHLFDTYIWKMLKRRGQQGPYTPEQTVNWLRYLEQNMRHHSQTIFLLEQLQPTWLERKSQKLFYVSVIGLIAGLIMGPLIGSIAGKPVFGLIGGIITALIVGPFFEQLFGEQRIDVEPVEKLGFGIWSWNEATGVIMGAIFTWLIIGTFLWLMGNLTIGIIFYAVVLTLIIGFVGGFKTKKIETKTIPNQGIQQSVKNFIIVTSSLIVLFGLIFGQFNYQTMLGSVGVSGAWSGGLAALQHYCLRFVLYYSGNAPWNYVCFLDYAVEHVFLQKVGGGYIFIHRLLLEHFASMNEMKVEMN